MLVYRRVWGIQLIDRGATGHPESRNPEPPGRGVKPFPIGWPVPWPEPRDSQDGLWIDPQLNHKELATMLIP